MHSPSGRLVAVGAEVVRSSSIFLDRILHHASDNFQPPRAAAKHSHFRSPSHLHMLVAPLAALLQHGMAKPIFLCFAAVSGR